ncbi:aldehyde dehydrogenase family protein [Leifsonia sp. fls2-241-R2A-40a]|uniref:aldehyde dehydrogenase family protein n=1 Tax=Leifsonia sp. fls2-241-R2A-40a TaxID=3040290 RepID=UPI00254FCAC7|nr:aldehyde dehydrogenase family protein [Leifsonia sp. fls2-241-R2A-40a]
MILSHDPRTGEAEDTGIAPSSAEDVERTVARAAQAARELAALDRHRRADLLETIAESAEASAADLVAVAARETGLGVERLEGEVRRSVFQFRLFAKAVREGGFLEAAIDHAGPTPLGPAPDVRRMLIPIGPVAVFGSSNFPFAFSVLGGDTASALAAGDPVVLKAHSSHPQTSALSHSVLRAAVLIAGFPEGTVGIVFGQEAGRALVQAPDIAAVGFTGSLGAAEALQSAIAERPKPIPFYGELSSINPLIVTPAAARRRGAEIARGLHGSVTGSGGQLCTKPGIAFIPADTAGDALVSELADSIRQSPAAVLLNARIAASYGEIRARLSEGAPVIATGAEASDPGYRVAPALLELDAADFREAHAEECFGPLVVVVRYRDETDLIAAFERIPASLTATIHSEPGDALGTLIARVQASSGRLVFDGYPTGVRVSWAQNHGGPWPATNTQHTSVGVTAVRRFLRPFAWQDAPQSVLPVELRDGDADIPRRVDGVLTMPALSAVAGRVA